MSVRRAATIAAAALAVGTLMPVAQAGDAYTTNCPPPENLVAGTDWTWHRVGPGVRLQEGQHHDATGRVRIHVLRVDVTNPHLRFTPLMRKVASRHRLSALAGDQRRVLAATNAGYFDYGTGAPTGPVIDGRKPLVATTTSQWVVGFGPGGTLQAGRMTVAGTVAAAMQTLPVVGVNAPHPVTGVTVYTPRWGDARVPTPRVDATARYVKHGAVASGSHRFRKAPSRGSLLVAKGWVAKRWLRSLHRGDPVSVKPSVVTDAPAPFTLGYAAGTQMVEPGGNAKLGLSCRRSYKQPARTGIGWTADGRTMLLVVVDDKKGSPLHGLDSIQLARVMADLGADQAYLLDGGGSTEMLAKIRGHRGLSLRNHLSDLDERAIPVGFGIVRR